MGQGQVPISIFGLGYVGSVMAACLARLGHEVIGVDVNAAKVEMINAGCNPIVEPGMDELTREQHRSGRLRATTDAAAAVHDSDVSFICVGTPCGRNGRIDLTSLRTACEQLGQALAVKDGFHTVAVRSTVLPGTIASVLIPVLECGSRKRAGSGFAVCSNPEFMREGSAITDFFQPPFTLLGAEDKIALQPLRTLYESISVRRFETSLRCAEMVKYVCNAFHALKIDFSNEIGTLAEHLGVDAYEVMDIVCADTKLNVSTAYMKPGFAFGGSCLAKDVKALTYHARQMDLQLPLLEAIVPSNHAQICRALDQIMDYGKRKIGFVGLSFKPGSDDLRESPMLELVKRLLGDGWQILIYDRHVSQSFTQGANRQWAELQIPHIFSLLCTDLVEVIRASEVIVVGHDNEYDTVSNFTTPEQIVLRLARPRPALEYTNTLAA